MSQVHFILDEAALLGQMTGVDDALGIGRGYGVKLQLYYQSFGQLKKCFPEGGEQTVLSNTTQVFFGVNDNATADYVSARLGEETIIVTGGGGGSSQTSNRSATAEGNSWSRSDSSNDNWSQQARRLLKPEEVAALSPRMAITFTHGVPPVMTRLIRYFEYRPKAWQSLASKALAATKRPPFGRTAVALVAQLLIAVPLAVITVATSAAAIDRIEEAIDAAEQRRNAVPASDPEPQTGAHNVRRDR